jgi:2-polyprenyl-3-methyl-5-hydroxy-6-metoxy-1,4-benzoquinol methylase
MGRLRGRNVQTQGMIQTTWSEQQVRALLRDYAFPYQRIELPYGLSTEGTDRSATANMIYPDDMTGKTVLDIGCKYGYFCFEALKRGARRAVGIDVDPESVRKARLLAQCLGADASFELCDVEHDPIEERFDYVLCLNLLHHLMRPVAVLDKLIEVTRERLILEVATLGRRDRRKLGVSWLQAQLIKRLPAMLVGRNGITGRRSSQKFFVTSAALENLLLYHRHMFARVDTQPSIGKSQRYISIARRRSIGELVVLAGPTSSGKTTLQSRLMGGNAPEVASRVGLEDPSLWQQVSAKLLPDLTASRVDRLLFHYDFLRPYLTSAQVHDRDEAMDILDTAEHVTFLTIWTPPERLRRQLHDSEIAPRTKLGFFRGKSRWRKIERDYEDPARICGHYRQWFEFARKKSDDHLVVEMSDPVRFYSVDEWERLVQEYGSTSS